MNKDELVGELLQALIDDVKTLQTKLDKLPTQTSPDYGASINELTKVVQGLQNQSKPTPPAIDLSPITSRLDRLERATHQSPERKMSQFLQVGAYGFGLMMVLLIAATWYALSWRSERNEYQQAFAADNWRVRYTRQADPAYYSFMEAKFKDSAIYQWILEQEEADQKRELAREAADQAKALSRQANELEGKEMTNRTGARGKKKG